MQYTAILAALAFGSAANAHMQMSFPIPFRSTLNKAFTNPDYSMTSPLSGAAQFPCKGYQTDFADTTGAGAPTATFTAGGPANFTVIGSAVHGGGSCQASLSYDGGKSFTVIHSYIGGCPLTNGQDFALTIPSDAKTGAAMFAWTWYNQIGNREIYMNCASVTIAAGSKRDAPTVAFSARPGIFVANLANGCTTVEGKDVNFPDPGPDVTGTPTGDGTFTGTCAAVNGIGGGSASSGSGSSSGSSASAAAPASSAASPVASSATTLATSASSAAASGGIFATSAASPASSAAASSTASASTPVGTATGSVSASANGQCAGSQTCAGQTQFGSCCSQWGYCGDTTLHCGTGCQSAFGTCGSPASNSTGSAGSASPSTAARDLSSRQYLNGRVGRAGGARVL
ncbi:hypothetical protein LSUE1_G009359 [Lachnellula suecica]|uniref:Chitin-binding type-1 domain-containing protein n=1 Tax=Lachnellula suecica TaxID=602035 RepID=A0A8T9BYX2_9HELO|nr:hypothetical protein LSUE1_G009359 [Lachnellula suecica]